MASRTGVGLSNGMLVKKQKFAVLLRDLDYQTYRAFKVVNSPSKENSKISFNPVFPFCVKTGRFQWQTQHEINGNDINGKMKPYASQTIDHSTSWTEFMNKSYEAPRKVIGNSKSFNTRMATLINTKRTMNPALDLFASKADFAKSTRLIRINRSKSSGAFESLMNKTPSVKKPKLNTSMTKETGIFTSAFIDNLPVSKHKTFVNLAKMKQRGDCAGSFKPKKDDDFLYEKPNQNHTFSRIKKIVSHQSDIFNANSSFNQNKKPHIYEYSEYLKQ